MASVCVCECVCACKCMESVCVCECVCELILEYSSLKRNLSQRRTSRTVSDGFQFRFDSSFVATEAKIVGETRTILKREENLFILGLLIL